MSLRQDAEAIWRAGVAAVDSASAVRRQISYHDTQLRIADVNLELSNIGRIEVVGAGKAGAGMVAGLESALLEHVPAEKISGWVNVPADCVRPQNRIHLHAARPAGINEPTADAVEGTREILRRISALTTKDVCIVLLSGGASALLCSPIPQITLADKLTVTRLLSSSGAPIQELNLVRTQLSQVKGGQLAAACRSGVLIALIISDVIGDPLEVIGSGPTVSSIANAQAALNLLQRRQLTERIPESVLTALTSRQSPNAAPAFESAVHNFLVASNAIALNAAAAKARELGYNVETLGSNNAGDAGTEGRSMMQRLLAARSRPTPDASLPVCILSGGEPTVQLSSSSITHQDPENTTSPAKGGRNQELVLAAISESPEPSQWHNLALLSGGTDGEDGPTDAAGAFADQAIVTTMNNLRIDPNSYLHRHDSYHFFQAVQGLFRTGPTHTNVMDLRVGLAE
jgi:glycerate-2-kinase